MKQELQETTENRTTRIIRDFFAAARVDQIVEAYNLHPKLDERTPQELSEEVSLVARLRGARALSLPEGDPMRAVFNSLQDPSVEDRRDQLVEMVVHNFVAERKLARTLEEMKTKNESYDLSL